jgi:hypothetical protein
VSRATQDTTRLYVRYMYGTITPYGPPFQMVPLKTYRLYVVLQPHDCRNNHGLGFSPFARHYLGNHYCFLLLQVLRCFSSLRSPSTCMEYPAFNGMGCPIRKSPDQRLFAPTRSLSQLITSFFASESLGIHHTPLLLS